MDLSKKERLILINQYEILKKLEPDLGKTYDELIEILEDGYKIFYNSTFYIDDEMSEIDSKMVLDILSFYRIVYDYTQKNPNDDDVVKHKMGYFKGFDGNHETKCYAFVRFLVDKQHKFTENLEYIKMNDYFNSHFPFKDKYQNMIKRWEELGKKYDLSKEDILSILNI